MSFTEISKCQKWNRTINDHSVTTVVDFVLEKRICLMYLIPKLMLVKKR